jgi:hypothetical protein
MSKPVSNQIAEPPVPKQRADASLASKKDTSTRRSQPAISPSATPEVPAAVVPSLELATTAGFIWS